MNDNSDDAISEALELLKQEKMIKASLANGRGAWTVVYDDWNYGDGVHGGRYACFAQPDQRREIISDPGWDFTPGDGCPGFSSRYQNGKEIVTYYRNDRAPAFEPLIIVQRFCDVTPDALILSEEFRLLMNLWQDPQTGNYFLIGNGDTKEPAVRFKNGKVEIRTPILRRYQAARQLDLVLFTDSVVFAGCHVSGELLHDLRIEGPTEEKLGYISRAAANDAHIPDFGSYSRVLMKRILPPPPQEKCRIGPWENKQEEYPEFTIGEDEDGSPRKYTCDPDKLANYFGKNPDAPHYLTPVFFKRSVLQPYYDESEIYTVGGHYLHCLQKWGVEIDNNNLERVAVFLGDIGRDIPSNDWAHWQHHNIPPGYGMGDSRILSQCTHNPEHLFKHKYSELQEEWEQSWGWRLHREPAEQDAGALKRLRVPLNETEAEFKQQLLNLALVLVDLLNEKSIGRECPEAKDEKGGISKLKCFLKHYSYPHVERDTSVLRTVQSMRSRIAAHASGSSGQKYLDEQLDGKTTQEYFVLLLEKAVTMLDSLIAFAVDKAG